jgi:hypothetical protein
VLVDNDDYKALYREKTNMLLVPHWEDDDGEQHGEKGQQQWAWWQQCSRPSPSESRVLLLLHRW